MKTRLLRREHRPVAAALGCAVLVIASVACADEPPPPARAEPAAAAAAAASTTPATPAAPAAPEVPVEERELDLDQIVTSAAKGVTTVQEAPAIITIITADEIRQRGWRDIGMVLSSIPGWIDTRVEGNQVVAPLARGVVQAVLYLRDGVSMFDPVFNVAALNRTLPLETIKRVEVVTGPGGVLWGANSYLGIVNVITKDGDDVNGVVASVGYGDGPGNAQDLRAYAMFGKSFLKNRLKVMLHTSFESYLGEQFSGREYLVGSPAPQPIGPAVFGLRDVSTNIARSWIFDLDGKLSYGPVSLYFQAPFGQLNYGSTFGPGFLGMDTLPGQTTVCNGCDRSAWNVFDRYGVLEYKDRFAGGKLGVDAKAYYINFNRSFQLRVFPSSTALPGGLSFQTPTGLQQRYGGSIDVDYSGPWTWNRLLGGAEVFHESASGDGPGGSITATFLQPDANVLNLPCPLDPSDPTHKKVVAGCPIPFIFGGAERTVVGVFVADQIRPYSKLTLDGGIRYQQAFGSRPYDGQVLGSAAAVWNFLPNFHLKLNWSMGFRPPVFNNTNGNGAAVQYTGNPNLGVEQADSYSAEVNARLLRDVGKVRELQLRLDYAYTLLDNVIVVRGGKYQNSGRRAIHSVEFLSKLYLTGDHYLTLAYTFQQILTSDTGDFRSVPRHYFQLGAVFSIVRGWFDLNGNLTIYGGADDPNRYPYASASLPGGTRGIGARITDFTFDRLPPVALLQLGARLHLWRDHIQVAAQFYNVLNQSYYQPDVFYDLTPIIENRPNPAPGWSFFSSVTLKL